MSFWSKLWKKSPAKPPCWSGFTSLEQYKQFVDLVIVTLQQQDVFIDPLDIQSGSVLVPDQQGGKIEWILYDLARQCSICKKEEWSLWIEKSLFARIGFHQKNSMRKKDFSHTDHQSSAEFDSSQNALKTGSSTSDSNFPFVHLRSQLFSHSYLQLADLDHFIQIPLTEDIRLVLVSDLANAAEITVSRQEARVWQKSDAELLTIGRKNGAAIDAQKIMMLSIPTAFGTIEVAVNNGFYLGACMLEVLERGEFPKGALVSMLSWHHFILHTVIETTHLEILQEMKKLIQELSQEIDVASYERLSTNLFWFHKDVGFITIPFQEQDGKLSPIIPNQLDSFLRK